VFDVLFRDGRNLTDAPYAERLDVLRATIQERPTGPVYLTPRRRIQTSAELDAFVAEMLREGMEGAVVKKLDAPYHAGAREYSWVKLKREYQPGLADTFDLVVVGYDRGQGRRAKLGIGSLLCCVYDSTSDCYRTITRVGSGLSDAQWIQLREALDASRVPDRPANVDSLIAPDVWAEPRHVVEVLAGGITRSPLHTCGKVEGQPGYALRFPRVVQIRSDRRPEDATTQDEVLEMYRMQEGEPILPRPSGHKPPR
jgi:DNA ligase-1